MKPVTHATTCYDNSLQMLWNRRCMSARNRKINIVNCREWSCLKQLYITVVVKKPLMAIAIWGIKTISPKAATNTLAAPGGFIKFLCSGSVGFFSRALIFFSFSYERKKRRQKQPGKLMAKSRLQPVNLSGARPLMNPLTAVGVNCSQGTATESVARTVSTHTMIMNRR